MPIILGDNASASIVDIQGAATQKTIKAQYSPKFFHPTVLTGTGGQSRGLLNESRDPKMCPNGYHVRVNPNLEFGTHTNSDVKIYNIPCFLMTPSLWDSIDVFDRPNNPSVVKIATDKSGGEVWLWIPIHAIQIEERENVMNNQGVQSKTITKTLSACFHRFLFYIADKTSNTHQQVRTINKLHAKQNTFHQDIMWDMVRDLRNIESELSQNGFFTDRTALNDYLQNYSLYAALCDAAERWQTEADYYVADLLMKSTIKKTNDPKDSLWVDSQFSVSNTLSRLEAYNIPLDQYQTMYNKMSQILPPDILNMICKSNLNLKLSNTLKHMNDNRANLPTVPCVNHIQSAIPYSMEQKGAIESTSPLTLVQSGAGTGKSTVILGRIDHMIANGVKPDDITVLSFTNAAADHIVEMKPGIHSMTIASMLHTIYAHNYPKHQLSENLTIINSIEIFFDATPGATTQNPAAAVFSDPRFLYDFKYILNRLENNNEYTRATNFVEAHFDDVIKVLDTIGQTSLALESIICYLRMDNLQEPNDIHTKHLIIDEVQDNSISEFIYSLKYTDAHECSLYIVGDCSQTLYEFRASNPKALNVLEGSGVFETHKLQTNYRSNQEILDFANVLLGNIEANQYANIRLRANSLKPVTLQSFVTAVNYMHKRLPNRSAPTIDTMVAGSLSVDMKRYIDDTLARGEQVTILAHKRSTLNNVKTHIANLYPNRTLVDISSTRQTTNTLFSKFISKYWDRIAYTPPLNILITIRRELWSNAQQLSYRSYNVVQKTQAIITKMMDDFTKEYGDLVDNWQKQVQNSVMTTAEMLDEIKKLMINFEIKRNAVSQAVRSAQNAEQKQAAPTATADFIVSTIHGVKGLEFDNVIVYYNTESTEEADKRMYYVALTRAKGTEFIYSFGSAARPKIQGDYDRIVKTLTAKALAANKAAGKTDDDDSDTDSDGTVDDIEPIDISEENNEPRENPGTGN